MLIFPVTKATQKAWLPGLVLSKSYFVALKDGLPQRTLNFAVATARKEMEVGVNMSLPKWTNKQSPSILCLQPVSCILASTERLQICGFYSLSKYNAMMEAVLHMMGSTRNNYSFHLNKGHGCALAIRVLWLLIFFQTGTVAHWGFWALALFFLQLLRMRMLCLTHVSKQRRFTSLAGFILLPGEE